MKKERFPDYKLIDTSDMITFGTTVYMRKDKRAIKVIFPSGHIMTFSPESERVEKILKLD